MLGDNVSLTLVARKQRSSVFVIDCKHLILAFLIGVLATRTNWSMAPQARVVVPKSRSAHMKIRECERNSFHLFIHPPNENAALIVKDCLKLKCNNKIERPCELCDCKNPLSFAMHVKMKNFACAATVAWLSSCAWYVFSAQCETSYSRTVMQRLTNIGRIHLRDLIRHWFIREKPNDCESFWQLINYLIVIFSLRYIFV